MGRPRKLETNINELRKEKATDDKQPSDQEREVEDKSLRRLEDLSGVGPVTAAKLRNLGYTLIGIATGRADEIASQMKVSFSKAKVWVMSAQEAVLCKMSMKSGNEIDRERKSRIQLIRTGSSNFNGLLGGGIHTGETTGICGKFSVGKSQICFDSIVDCISRLKRKAVYIETEPNTFHADRLKQIATLRKVDIDLDDVYVCESTQIPTAKAQFLQYKVIQKELQSGADIGLVCIDSFTAKFRPGYSRREMLPVRTREFTEHFHLIDYLSSKYNIAFILTCQVIGAPDPGQTLGIKMITGDSYYPVGGNYLLHSMTTWVSLQQIKTELYKAILFDSSYLPRGSCEFMLTKSGLSDGVR